MYIENNQLHVTCSPAVNVMLRMVGRTGGRGSVFAPSGETITEAVFDLRPEDQYIRVEVTDAAGKKAFTHAYPLAGIVEA